VVKDAAHRPAPRRATRRGWVLGQAWRPLETFLMAVGPWQIVLIALVILLLFGAGRLGDIGKGLGEGIRNFKKGITEDPDESDDDADEEDEEPKQLAGKSLSDKQAVRK